MNSVKSPTPPLPPPARWPLAVEHAGSLRAPAPLLDRLAQFADDIGWILCAEDGGPGHDHVRAGIRGLVDCAQSQSAVDFDVEVGISCAQGLDLGEFGGHEFLAAEAGVYGHDEDHLFNPLSALGFLDAEKVGRMERKGAGNGGNGVAGQKLTSGRSARSGLSRMSHNTSTGVSGLIATPACMPSSWIYLINWRGLVRAVVVLSVGSVAATEETAAS